MHTFVNSFINGFGFSCGAILALIVFVGCIAGVIFITIACEETKEE